MSQHIANHIKVVLFDHDDTLFGTIGPKWAEHKYVAKTYYDKDLTDDEIRPHWGKPLHELVCLLYGTDDVDQAMAYNIKHHEEYPKLLFTETVPMLKHVKSLGKKIGVITATHRFSFEYDLKSAGVPKELLDFTQTADEVPFHKPDPRVFDPAIKWLKKQGIKSDEVLYVGDGLHDMKAALGAGFNFLGVETGLVTAEEFKKAGGKSIASVKHLIS